MDSDEKPSKNKELGIFSSPDLTVDTEKLAGFGRNAATAKTQELQSTVKSTGDKKRNVIPLIIAATVILVVGGIVAGIALSKNVSQGSGSAAESGQKFDQFATYLLFMESSTNLSGEYEPGHSYQLSEHFYSETPDDNYWETSGLLLKNAVEAYSAMQNGQSQDMLSRLQDYQTRFKVLQTCHALGDPTQDQLIASYIASGLEGAKAFVENYYSPLTDIESATAQEIANGKIIYNQLYLDYLDAAFKGGCIKDGKIAQQCSGGGDSAMSTLDYLDLLGEMNLAENAASALVLNLVDDLEEQCWTIHGELSNTVSVLLSYPKGAA